MRKWIKGLCCVLATLAIMPTALVGCNKENANAEYTVQYTDDDGVHTFKVKKGGVYALEHIPERTGYDFLGLFDSASGGKQYVGADGSALSAYAQSKNIVLFPQWKAKEYTLVLDYQDAPVVGDRQKTVSYGTSITELPIGLSLPNHDFTGWYTQPNGAGVQIADQYGIVPENSKITERVFDLSDKDGYIKLYAGFALYEHKVTLHFAEGETETVSVSHGTKVKNIVYDTRVNGQGVLTWSTKENDTEKTEVFNGAVEKFMTLYAVEYAPVIDFDTDGGNALAPIVAKSGATVALPTPEKENYKFLEWQDMDGNTYTANTMPENGKKLKAIWQAKIVFDENGGTEVKDISQKAGEAIVLPAPQKDGYLFAGWYTSDKERYEASKMPVNSIVLKAGWYKTKKESVVVITENNSYTPNGDIGEVFLTDSLTIDMSSFLPSDFSGMIEIDAQIKTKFTGKDYVATPTIMLRYYTQNTASASYFLFDETIVSNTSEYKEHTFSKTFYMTGNIMYGARVCNIAVKYHAVTDYCVQVTYPDTTKLYL